MPTKSTTQTMPLAQQVPKDIQCEHEFHNRVRKAMLAAFDLFWNHFDGRLTDKAIDTLASAAMADAASRLGMRTPSEPTEDLIRAFLHDIRKAHTAVPVDNAVSSTDATILRALATARSTGNPVVVVLPARP